MTIQTITLSQLALSPLNARKVKPSQIETLAEDIAAHGIIQSLGVYEEEGKFHVFAGGRRYRALKHLQKAKVIGGDYAVPVTVRSKAEALELSTAENMSREAMHPADQVRAFAAMRADGHTQGEIAARFGYSEGHVGKLLKLGSLAPALLTAMAKNELSLDSAKALCLTDDHAAQRAAFKACGDSSHSIRRYFGEGKVKTSDRLFRFIGREAYEEAGGTITVDLFSEGSEGYADDPELVDLMAREKLAELAAGFEGQGWAIVRAEPETPSDWYSLRPMYPTERDLTEDEDAALAAVEADLERAEEAGDDGEWERLDGEREEILDAARAFTPEQMQGGGVIVTIDYHGDLALKHFHLAQPKNSAAKAGAGEAPAPYSAKLIEDMGHLRTLALQGKVAADGTLAFDIVIDTLAASLLHGRWSGETGVGIRPELARIPVSGDLHDERLGGVAEALATRFASLPATDRFAAIRSMGAAEKLDLFAGLVASTIASAGQGSAYAEAAGVDMTEVWRVNVPFCDRLTKKQMLDIMADECGEAAADNCKALKKGDLAVQLADRLPAGWLPEPMRGASPAPQTEDEQSSEAA